MSADAPEPGVDWRAAYRYLEEQLESVLRRVADRMEQLETRAQAAERTAIRSVTLERVDPALLRSVIAADGADLSFAFYVYRDDVLVREQAYTRSNTLQWSPDRSGAYRVRGFVRRGNDKNPTDTKSSALLQVTAS